MKSMTPKQGNALPTATILRPLIYPKNKIPVVRESPSSAGSSAGIRRLIDVIDVDKPWRLTNHREFVITGNLCTFTLMDGTDEEE